MNVYSAAESLLRARKNKHPAFNFTVYKESVFYMLFLRLVRTFVHVFVMQSSKVQAFCLLGVNSTGRRVIYSNMRDWVN